ncbi:MAG: tRNA pseudouridine(55) synthase TruB [Gammaproteobacteria bacterium]|nr:tRNA pseudouridine(55) synthase TruB [Gammaproteobacteria bacterium]
MSRRKRKGRALNGLLLLDKPSGITSNLALQKVKKIFNADKAGHTGSLDPLATGLLVICFGRATKLSDFLLNSDKHYQVLLKLGVSTDTGDADGRVTGRQDALSVTDVQIHRALRHLTGDVEQTPPMYSALKYQGTRLYKLARKGIEVERPPRQVKVHKFELIKRDAEILQMDVHCSKGTYVRTLAEDLGEYLGCGAHVFGLRRTGLGPFVNRELHTLMKLDEVSATGFTSLDEMLLPVDDALQSCPAVLFDETMMEKIRNGHPVRIPQSPTQDIVRIYDVSKRFFGIGTVLEDGRIVPKRLD